MTVGACGPDSGTGIFGAFDARVVLQSPDVRVSRENVRTIVERNHGGSLDKEFTDTDTGFFDWTEQSVLTFRVPAEELDRVIGELEGSGIGVTDTVNRASADSIKTQSDLSKIYDVIKNDVADIVGKDGGSNELQDAQDQLKQLADRSNLPVLVVDIRPAPRFIDYAIGFLTHRLVVIVPVAALLFFVLKRKEGKQRTQTEDKHKAALEALRQDQKRFEEEREHSVALAIKAASKQQMKLIRKELDGRDGHVRAADEPAVHDDHGHEGVRLDADDERHGPSEPSLFRSQTEVMPTITPDPIAPDAIAPDPITPYRNRPDLDLPDSNMPGPTAT